MVDKIDEPGGLTSKADANKDRVAEVSNVSRTINEMQKKVDQKVTEANLNIGDYEKIEEVQSSMIKVLNVLSDTVGTIGYGFKKAATAIPQVGKEAISQYGKAISQDISFNKQNVVAMALAKTSPLFGYFASKFMETDVFKSAASKMKANIGAALGGVTSKFKEGFGSLFSKFRSKAKKDKPVKTITAEDANPEIPKMAKGGFVKKAGLAYLHPAEIVVPIDKILGRIDESISTTRELAQISKKAQLKTMAKMHTYVEGTKHMEKVGLFKGFVRALNDVQMRHTEPSNVRMLRAVLAIQDTMGATVGTWSQVYQKMLIQNPFFRNVLFSLKGISSVLTTPAKLIYQVFKSRGGYAGHLSHAKNPSQAAAENIGLVYTEGMWRLDNIALYTRATAEATRDLSTAITGKKYKQLEGVGTGVWTIIGFARSALNFTTEKTIKGIAAAFGSPEFMTKTADFLTKDREFLVTTLLDKLQGRKEKKGVYGEGGMVEALQDEPFPISDGVMSVIDQHLIDLFEGEKKKDRKMLGYSKDLVVASEENLKIQKKMNFRQIRQSVFSAFGSAFSSIKSLLGLLPAFIPFLMGGGIRRWVGKLLGGVISTTFKKLFKTGILSKLPQLATTIGSFATKLGPMLLKFGGPLAALATAGFVGWKMGQGIDKLLGISEKFQARLDIADAKSHEEWKGLKAEQNEMFARAKEGSATGKREVKMQTLLGTASARRQADVGYFGRGNLDAITTAQQKYMNENMDTYLNYSYEEIQTMREKWFRTGGYISKGMMGDPASYGKQREAAFMTYLMKTGTTLADRSMGVVADPSALAKGEATAEAAKDKPILEEMKRQGKAALEGTRGLGAGIRDGLVQTSNAVSTSVANISTINNNNNNTGQPQLSPYALGVMRGEMVEV